MIIAYSPCPNDTFAFYAWSHGKIPKSPPIEPELHDIDTLNAYALEGRYPVTKVSAYMLGKITKEYVLLPSGAAIGFGVGPKLIGKEKAHINISEAIVAVPGFFTTAHLLLQLLLPKPKKIISLPYHEILTAIESGVCDLGVIIHETRFTFQNQGFVEIQDLGTLFKERYKSQIPLGVVVAKRSLGKDTIEQIQNTLHASIQYAYAHPDEAQEYIKSHAQEKRSDIIQSHIDLYVNSETCHLSLAGYQSIATLLQAAIDKNLLDTTALEFCYE